MDDERQAARYLPGATMKVRVRPSGGPDVGLDDLLAVEEPLEIRVVAGEGAVRSAHSVAVTMRTPGHDFELAAGFLMSEGALRGAADVWRMARCSEADPESAENVVEVHLVPDVSFDPERFSRHVFTSSSCGVCGKASIERLREVRPAQLEDRYRVDPGLIQAWPAKLLEAQPLFARTGGLHAAGLFDPAGRLLLVREDVGRHNAVDKIVGHGLLEDELPLANSILLVSGRASFELVHKALMAGIPTLLAVGAPSSLAVETAREFGMTLIGFLKPSGFNLYSGAGRVLGEHGT